MSNEIIKQQYQPLQLITDEELTQHLENMGLMKDLNQGEKNTYLQIAKAFNLNPFKREIYVSKYNGQMSIIVGYETYIKRAERSGMLDGWEVTTSGEVKDNSLKAIITIYRKDRSRPFVWEAKYSEYVQKTKEGAVNKFWQKAETMIKKVAMAQGFRLCFNDELGGMPYTAEEVDKDAEFEVIKTEINNPAPAPAAHAPQKPTAARIKKAIADITAAKSKEEMSEIKKTLLTESVLIVEDKSFVDASTKHYNVLMAAAAWSLTPETQIKLEALIKSSTLNDMEQAAAAKRIAAAKSDADVLEIETYLNTKQPA